MILVVDHDPEVLDQAREVLNHDRHVLAVSNAEQALAMVRRLTFSVVLVDLELPDDAFALIRNLHEADPDLPVIAVIAAVKAAIPVTTKTAGVVEFLPKPISPTWKPAVERVRASKRGA
jgi:two-component system C4-dicarboxylate transport response regulator DctD